MPTRKQLWTVALAALAVLALLVLSASQGTPGPAHHYDWALLLPVFFGLLPALATIWLIFPERPASPLAGALAGAASRAPPSR